MIPWRCQTRSVALVLNLVLLSGCPKSQSPAKSEGDPTPYAGAEIRVVLPAELDLVSSWTPGFEDWAAEASASYEINEVDFSQATGRNDQWLAALKSAAPTLVLLPTPLVNRLTGEGLAAPIPESSLAEDDLDWNRLLPTVRKALGMQGNAPTVYPATCSSLVIYCRTDLLDAAGRKVPETWEEYDALVTSVDEWAPDHMAIEPRGDDSLATLFLSRAAASTKSSTQFSFELDVSTGDPLIASEGFVQTLKQMQKLSQNLAPESQSSTFEDCRQAFSCGRAAIAIGTLSGERLVACDPPMTSGAGFPWKMVPLPGSRSIFDRETGEWNSLDAPSINRPAFCGFAGFSVCVLADATEVEQQAAWDLWGKLVRLQNDGLISPLPGVSCGSFAIAGGGSVAGGGTPDTSSVTMEQAMIPDDPQLIAELPCLGREAMLAALSNALRQAIDDRVAADAALEQASQAWNKIIDDIGRPQVLNSYRQRLGLTPIR